ncbi:MAG: HAD family phosphatase [Clostridiales bacterium]|nr:HAD family phosphatase [Clostridiales bacterium]
MTQKNIVFDMGGVLIEFDPDRLLAANFESEDIPAVRRLLFGSDIWHDFDRGLADEDETAAKVCKELPERLHSTVYNMFHNLCEQLPPYEDMYGFIKELKDQGYRLYLLSNAAQQFYDKRDQIPVMGLLDGIFFSYMCHYIKPEEQIYRLFFEKFSLKPEDCFFVDDLQRNIDGGLALGMDGHCFADHDIDRLREVIKAKCPVLPKN